MRHGQTAANRSGLLQGRVDPPLTDFGRVQAAAVARALRGCGARRVVSSPLRRAVETASTVAGALGLPVDSDERLVEIDYGDWDERPLREIAARDWAAWRADPTFVPPGGESLRAVMTRAVHFASDALAAATTVVAVSHVSPIKAIVAWALGADERATWRMHLDVASICRVGGAPDAPLLHAFNAAAADVAH